jgi:hypothetical protein
MLVLTVTVLPYCKAYTYFYFYWTVSTLLIFIGFGVLYEVFLNLLKPYSAVIDLGKLLFRWAALFLLIVALITGLATSGSQNKLVAGIELLDRSVRLMQCGLLLLLLFFEKRLLLSFRNHGMCISLGLGTASALGLIMSYLQGLYPSHTLQLDIIYNFCYVGTLLYWVVGLTIPEPQRRTVLDSPSRLIFQRWDEALASTPLGRGSDVSFSPVDSFIPGVEKAVERVLARKMVQ